MQDFLFVCLACGSSAPVRVEHEGGAAAWVARTLAAPTLVAMSGGAGTSTASTAGVMALLESFFEPLVTHLLEKTLMLGKIEGRRRR